MNEVLEKLYRQGWRPNIIVDTEIERLTAERDALRAELAAAKIEIERQRARVNKWVNAAMRNEEYDDE